MHIFKSIIGKSCNAINRIMPIHVSVFRYIQSHVYDKEQFLLKDTHNVFATIHETKYWGGGSGGGSSFESTSVIRKMLPEVFKKYSIETMLDVPCGDYAWMKTVEKPRSYIGGDIVEDIIQENQKLYSSDGVHFITIDITKDPLPTVDLVFCKDCLQHLCYENVKKSINNFKDSKSKYLLVTSYPKTLRNYDIYDGDCRALNLTKSPFCLPDPLLKIKETSTTDDDKTMYLYKLEDISYM